jgi:hypothetical protein
VPDTLDIDPGALTPKPTAPPEKPGLDPAQAHRVELPGGWADLRPVSDVTERMRRPIKRLSAKLTSFPSFMNAVSGAMTATANGTKEIDDATGISIAASMGDAFEVLEELQDALVVAVTRGWSWEQDVSADGVLDLPGPALDALRQAVAPWQRALNPNFEPTPAPASPTGPSSA